MKHTDFIFLSHCDLPDTLTSLGPLIFALVISKVIVADMRPVSVITSDNQGLLHLS